MGAGCGTRFSTPWLVGVRVCVRVSMRARVRVFMRARRWCSLRPVYFALA